MLITQETSLQWSVTAPPQRAEPIRTPGLGLDARVPTCSEKERVPVACVPGMKKASVPGGAEAGAVPPVGLEPTTFGLKVRSSDQLS